MKLRFIASTRTKTTSIPQTLTTFSTRRPSLKPSSSASSPTSSRSISTIRARKLATSSFFLATFLFSFITVGLSASTLLPCPAKKEGYYNKNLSAEQEEDGLKEKNERENALIGQRLQLGKKGGWIEIEAPVRRKEK